MPDNAGNDRQCQQIPSNVKYFQPLPTKAKCLSLNQILPIISKSFQLILTIHVMFVINTMKCNILKKMQITSIFLIVDNTTYIFYHFILRVGEFFFMISYVRHFAVNPRIYSNILTNLKYESFFICTNTL